MEYTFYVKDKQNKAWIYTRPIIKASLSMNSLPDSVLGGESKDLNEKAAEFAGDTLETPEPELPAVLLKRHIILTSFFWGLSSFREH